MRHLEDFLQKSIIKYWDLKYPKWKKRLVHAPNGGKRNAIEAAKFKQMGVRAGFPDLILLIPNKFYPFCGIELKVKTGRQSESQKEYQKEFFAEGQYFYFLKRHNMKTFYRCPVENFSAYVLPVPDDEKTYGEAE